MKTIKKHEYVIVLKMKNQTNYLLFEEKYPCNVAQTMDNLAIFYSEIKFRNR